MILQYKENKMINYASMNLLKIPASVMAVTVMMFSLSFSGGASATTGTVDGISIATLYLIKQGICTKDKCLEFDMTASIELMWLGLNSFEEAHGLLLSISDMELHLSDEARGLPPVSAVSIPAAVWLFGSAIACLTGFSRFKKKAA